MNDTYFKISIIDGAIELCNYHNFNSLIAIDEAIKYLKNGPTQSANYDYIQAKALCELTGYDLFYVDGSRQEQLRKILFKLVLELKPFWARISHLGRNKVQQILSQDQLQCLKYAGLLDDDPSGEVVTWWEEIAKVFRVIDEEQKLKIGREGELKTIEFEKSKLKAMGIHRSPKWISIEDNTAGYDVLSYRYNNMDLFEIKIEVKAYTYGLPHFFLTRNEWDTALINKDNYIFHIWDITNEKLIEMCVDDMIQHIPIDQGLGKWHKFKIVLQ